jgi:hypothetical protein
MVRIWWFEIWKNLSTNRRPVLFWEKRLDAAP